MWNDHPPPQRGRLGEGCAMKLSCLAIVSAIACCGLAACVSPEQQRAQDSARCSGYGFASGSEGYANCMMQTSMARDQGERDKMAQFWAQDNATRRERERLAGLPPRGY